MSKDAFSRIVCQCGTEFFGHAVLRSNPNPTPECPFLWDVDRPCPGCGELTDVVRATLEDYIT